MWVQSQVFSKLLNQISKIDIVFFNDIMNLESSNRNPVISAYIITKNEEKNIGRALKSVQWMDELVVLDSGSTDNTVKIAEKFGTKVEVDEFKEFVEQKNKAMEFCKS